MLVTVVENLAHANHFCQIYALFVAARKHTHNEVWCIYKVLELGESKRPLPVDTDDR